MKRKKRKYTKSPKEEINTATQYAEEANAVANFFLPPLPEVAQEKECAKCHNKGYFTYEFAGEEITETCECQKRDSKDEPKPTESKNEAGPCPICNGKGYRELEAGLIRLKCKCRR